MLQFILFKVDIYDRTQFSSFLLDGLTKTSNSKSPDFFVDHCAFSFWGYDHLVYNVVQQSNVTASIAYLVVDGSGDLVGTEKELFFSCTLNPY